MKNYTRVNNITGWFTFLIAAYVFIMTIEPTGSFWDCGEFTATTYKLEVGHPPGAPVFLMLGKIFTLFAGDNVKLVSVMLNIMSALMSAFAVLFLFWTITAIAKKIAVKSGELTEGAIMTIMGAGMVGALAYAFSDSFWFSAEEAEVYASSQCFTAAVFWLIFKWESVADEKHSSRYLVLIAYVMGLSIGVHLLNLLTIPAVAFVYYFRKFPVTRKGVILTSIVSVGILGFVQVIVISGFVSIAAKFDLLFVNSFGLPFNSGILFFSALMVFGLVWGIKYTKKHNKPLWNIVILSFIFLYIGYASFGQVVVRSLSNPPLDENNPENVYNLISFLNREQYGERPLLYGQYYTAKVTGYDHKGMNYTKVEGINKYVEIGERMSPIYEDNKCTIFPRMFSSQSNHVNVYKEYAGIKGDKTPSFGQNLGFFFSYQVGAMFWRYFLWNFAGRQNDMQGPGSLTRGNWITGFKAFDSLWLGDQSKLPQSLLINKGRNTFFALPLILGLIGLFYHYKKDNKDAWVVMLLFFMTGLAIVIYLNQTPQQPRERDYAYAGSTYAYAVWIGLGVMALVDYMRKKMKETMAAVLCTGICLLAVPGLMAKEGWDDHDRSHRFTSRDFAYDYLNSCAPNAILFTNGDNDTFPLWYAQEVEGIRTDIRVVNLSLLNTDWYIDQLKRQYYESAPLPLSIPSDKYLGEKMNVTYYMDNGLKDTIELKNLLDFIVNDPRSRREVGGGESVPTFSAKSLKISVDPAAAIASGTVAKEDAGLIVREVAWTIDQNYIQKNDLIILDILAHNNWQRPVYFATTVGTENFLNLEDYFQLEGLTYRIVPIKTARNRNEGESGRVATTIMYDNVMNKFDWGNMNNPKVYMDENNLRMTTNIRINCSRLAGALLSEGKREQAEKVLDKSLEMMPDTNVPFNFFVSDLPEIYYSMYGPAAAPDSMHPAGSPDQANQKRCTDKANALVKRLYDIYSDNITYYLSLKSNASQYRMVNTELRQSLYVIQKLEAITRQFKQKDLNTMIAARLNSAMGQTGDVFQQ